MELFWIAFGVSVVVCVLCGRFVENCDCSGIDDEDHPNQAQFNRNPRDLDELFEGDEHRTSYTEIPEPKKGKE